MHLKDLTVHISNLLENLYPESEIKSMIYGLYSFVFGFSKFQVSQKAGTVVQEKDVAAIKEMVKDLQRYKPLQYVLGETGFYNCRIRVGEGVLIPRPETEELADWIIKSEKPEKVLDLCTGSGCLAIVLAKNLPGSTVFATDSEEVALKYAVENARLNDVHVTFIRNNILKENLPWNGTCFDLIVSNPPYIRESEALMMQQNVLNWEPEKALFVPDDDPLIFYRSILHAAGIVLKKGGRLYFEINETLGDAVREAFAAHFYSTVEIRTDLSGKQRMVRGTKT